MTVEHQEGKPVGEQRQYGEPATPLSTSLAQGHLDTHPVQGDELHDEPEIWQVYKENLRSRWPDMTEEQLEAEVEFAKGDERLVRGAYLLWEGKIAIRETRAQWAKFHREAGLYDGSCTSAKDNTEG